MCLNLRLDVDEWSASCCACSTQFQYQSRRSVGGLTACLDKVAIRQTAAC